MKKIKKFLVYAIFTCLVYNSQTFADNILGPGAIQQEIRQQNIDDRIQKRVLEKEHEMKQQKGSQVAKPESRQKDVKKGDVIYNPKFQLNKINFEGNKVYKTQYLEDFARPLVGQMIYVDDIIDLASRITNQYQYDGYITSFAYVPEQDVIDGVVTIRIVESKVKSIDVEGNKWTRKAYVTHEICNLNGLKEDKVFNVRQIDSLYKTVNKMPYLKANVSVDKKDNLEDTNVNVTVEDRLPVTLNMQWDNHGRDIVGEQRYKAVLTHENLTGFGDTLYGGIILASRTTGVSAGYKIPVSPWGTKLAFDYGYTNVRIGGDFSELGIKGQSTSYLLRLIQPIYKTSDTEIEASVGIDFANSNTNAMGGLYELGDYSLRVIRANIYGSHDDKTGTTFAIINGDFGLTGLGATSDSNGEPDTAFQKVGANIIRLQRIPLKDSYLVMRVGGQWSPNQLYPMEQYQLGGYNNVRGYQTGSLIGDYGVSGSVELRTPIPGFKKILPEKYKHISDYVKLLAFYDFGYVSENEKVYNYSQKFLMSCGGGINIFFPNGIALNVAVGIPLGQKDYATSDARLHFSLSTDIDRLIYRRFKKESI